MTSPTLRIASLGECMIELSPLADDQYRQGFAGDTYNTAYYLKRLLGEEAQVSYVTALGDDRFSDRMCRQFAEQGLDTSLIARLPGKRPGLYLIENDEAGERYFHYWRDSAAARSMLDGPTATEVLKALSDFDALYLSGITLAILAEDARARLLGLLRDYRGTLLFDPNYRPALWRNADEASRVMAELVRCGASVLTTLDDERALLGFTDAEQVIEHWRSLGATEVVVKQGAEGCLVAGTDGRLSVPAQPGIAVVDTTGAGDSFNAGFLAGRLSGLAVEESARLAHALAGTVIQHRGAIVPGSVGLPGLQG